MVLSFVFFHRTLSWDGCCQAGEGSKLAWPDRERRDCKRHPRLLGFHSAPPRGGVPEGRFVRSSLFYIFVRKLEKCWRICLPGLSISIPLETHRVPSRGCRSLDWLVTIDLEPMLILNDLHKYSKMVMVEIRKNDQDDLFFFFRRAQRTQSNSRESPSTFFSMEVANHLLIIFSLFTNPLSWLNNTNCNGISV